MLRLSGNERTFKTGRIYGICGSSAEGVKRTERASCRRGGLQTDRGERGLRFLMTYEWGYTYGPPMAVAPLDKVRQVVEYALSQIPAEKLILGIPNYGYDWQLPYERGVTRAQTIGNVQAVDLAVETAR